MASEKEIHIPPKDVDVEVDTSKHHDGTPETASQASQSKAEFLSSFTQEENKAIMRKVDRRFLLIIGLMYVIKNVGYLLSHTARREVDDSRSTTPTPRLPKSYKSENRAIF